MRVILILALVVCLVAAGSKPKGGKKCPKGSKKPLPPPTDEQAKQAAAGMTSAMKPKANERSQRFIQLSIPKDAKTCPAPKQPSKKEVEKAMAMVKEQPEGNIPPGMVVDQIMIFDKNGKYVRTVASDPYVPDSPERPDSAVQQ